MVFISGSRGRCVCLEHNVMQSGSVECQYSQSQVPAEYMSQVSPRDYKFYVSKSTCPTRARPMVV